MTAEQQAELASALAAQPDDPSCPQPPVAIVRQYTRIARRERRPVYLIVVDETWQEVPEMPIGQPYCAFSARGDYDRYQAIPNW